MAIKSCELPAGPDPAGQPGPPQLVPDLKKGRRRATGSAWRSSPPWPSPTPTWSSRQLDQRRNTARKLTRWNRKVHLHKVVTGDEARAHDPRARAPRRSTYEDSRQLPRLGLDPTATPSSTASCATRAACASSYTTTRSARTTRPSCACGPTTTGLGLELDTWLFGIQIGIEEGIEFHFLNLTFGIDLFPPALKLPFAPRLGFQEPTFFD